ncbi:hypothetical protein [Tenggerimyces flavus]|uniref:Lipoprotein n=1 Tax=Tenggerimyces flavus TaxID=1708749 RepID=A0ABV7Y6S6_9ACTN|nr:hypothetical protein [Tenggerimyces flavus]MBM7785424.1 hypothetical protein [Tenggerimyces flavus]
MRWLFSSVLVTLLLAGCGASPPPLSTAEAVATTLAAEPTLRWKGSWTYQGDRVSVDVRTMGAGDLTGVLDVGGESERLVVTGNRQLGRTSGWSVVFRRPWQNLAPDALAKLVREVGIAPTTGDAAYARPPGVATDALHLDLPNVGTLWLSAGSPHPVVGYSGDHLPASGPIVTDPIPIALTATRGTVAEATETYRAMAADLRGVPGLIPVEFTGKAFEVDAVTPPSRCRRGNCPIEVTGHNVSDRYHLRPVVRAVLSGNLKSAGECLVRLPLAAPGATVSGSCDVDDKRIDEIWAASGDARLRLVQWQADPDVQPAQYYEPANGVELADQLTARAARP